ncbi:MAG: hypothetical protein ACKV0T_28270 [Planctomycetales bacterium]
MSMVPSHGPLRLPESLEAQLHEFRRRVWSIKMIEAVCGALFGVFVGFLVLFVLDRVWDTPQGVRTALFLGVVAGCALVPLALHRWVWRHRRLEQLATLLSRKLPQIGDQLLGIIELVRNEQEQTRSWDLCQAAVVQVAADASRRDFRQAVPNPRHRMWGWALAVPAVGALVLLGLFPSAAANAWARLLAPWLQTPRYTFTKVEQLPERIVVAHGESFTLPLQLSEGTVSRPAQGEAQFDGQRPVFAALSDQGQSDQGYAFEMPSQIQTGVVTVRIGDWVQRVTVEPMLRPELTQVVAEVTLPAYLQRTSALHRDVRGGAISLVNGSQAQFTATVGRELASAAVDGQAVVPKGGQVTSPVVAIDGPRKVEFRWQDQFGLASREPFTLTVAGQEDEAPSLVCEDLPRQKVVLDSEVLSFKVRARDDFGVKRVGIEWEGIENPVVKTPAKGERILAAGGSDQENLDVAGTFSARALEIEPQPIALRVFVEDYLPGRERVYSPVYMFYILSPEQHAIWITEQLSKWQRQSLEVRDRELQLHETNKQVREMTQDELDQPDARRRLEAQAAGERSNGRRLTNLTASGEELVRQAMRNPEIGVGHLEKWAEMLQILKDISGNRMPSVAELLKEAAQSPQMAQNDPSKSEGKPGQTEAKQPPQAGQSRDNRSGSGANKPEDEPKKSPTIPAIKDGESSQQPRKEGDGEDEEEQKAQGKPSLSLPVTTVMGTGKKKKGESCPAGDKVDEAVEEQQDLLAEFEKISDELNRVLANLEGSTLLKRLKAASRLQYNIAGRISDQLGEAFGASPTMIDDKAAKVLEEMSQQEAKGSQDVSTIMDDMHSYFERRRFMKFKTVLDEMKEYDVIGSLRQLGDDLRKENGLSIAQAEYWSDTLDRWAEDLVDPASGGT